jgi:hypothetical protein
MSSGIQLVPQARGRGKTVKARIKRKGGSLHCRPLEYFIAPSFRGAKRTRNLEIPDSMLRIAPE